MTKSGIWNGICKYRITVLKMKGTILIVWPNFLLFLCLMFICLFGKLSLRKKKVIYQVSSSLHFTLHLCPSLNYMAMSISSQIVRHLEKSPVALHKDPNKFSVIVVNKPLSQSWFTTPRKHSLPGRDIVTVSWCSILFNIIWSISVCYTFPSKMWEAGEGMEAINNFYQRENSYY